MFSIPDQYDFTEEQRKSFDMLEKAYKVIEKYKPRWSDELKVYRFSNDSKRIDFSLVQGRGSSLFE